MKKRHALFAGFAALLILASVPLTLSQFQGDFSQSFSSKKGTTDTSEGALLADENVYCQNERRIGRNPSYSIEAPSFWPGTVRIVDLNYDGSQFTSRYDRYTNLKAAVRDSSSGDRIYLCPGTYEPMIEVNGIDLYFASLSDNTDTIIEGQNKFWGMHFINSESEMHDITIQNMRSTHPRETRGAAAILHRSELLFNEMVFVGNQSENYGAGIHSWQSIVEVQSSHFEENSALEGGGAIFLAHSIFDLHDSDFHKNSAGYRGGAIYFDIEMSDQVRESFQSTWNQFKENTAENGAAIFVADIREGEFNSSNDIFEENEAQNAGGAVTFFTANVDIQDAHFTENVSHGTSAAIHGTNTNEDFEVEVSVQHSIFARNRASASGAVGIRTIYSSDFINNIFDSNTSSALKIHGDDYLGETHVEGNLFSKNGPHSTSTNSGGGGLHIQYVDQVNVQNNSFVENRSRFGGGIYLHRNNDVVVLENYFNKNYAMDFLSQSALGGAIYVKNTHGFPATLQIEENVFEENMTQAGVRGNEGGGALYVEEDGFYSTELNLINNSFNSNQADNTGAVLIKRVEGLLATGNTFYKNSSRSFNSGAVTVDDSSASRTDLVRTFNNNTFASNYSAHSGGAFYLRNSYNLTLDSNTFYENMADFSGGAIYYDEPNSADRLSAISMTNNVFEANTSQYTTDTTCGSRTDDHDFNSQGFNISSDDTCRLDHTEDIESYAGSITSGVLQDNSGPTYTISVSSGSPAYETGTCSQATDQRGLIRTTDCERGAYEDPEAITVE